MLKELLEVTCFACMRGGFELCVHAGKALRTELCRGRFHRMGNERDRLDVAVGNGFLEFPELGVSVWHIER